MTTKTKHLTTAMLMTVLLGVGLTTGNAFGDTAVANYNGAWDSNSNADSSVSGTTDIDTLSTGF